MFDLNIPIDITLEDAIDTADGLMANYNRQVVIWQPFKNNQPVSGYWIRFDDSASVIRLTRDGLDGYDLAVVYIAYPKGV